MSRSTFLSNGVIPAHRDDTFMNDTCLVCWGTYDDEHPAVRILPCNHVFGRDCVAAMTKGPNGELCPICTTRLFNLSLLDLAKRHYDDVLTVLAIYLCLVGLGFISPYLPSVFVFGFVLYTNPYGRILDNAVLGIVPSLVAFGTLFTLKLMYKVMVKQIIGM